jgi:hypothetical protein
MMKLPIVMLLLAAVFAVASAFADDTLLKAVGFALTGSDDAKVRVIKRADCVFEIVHPNVLPNSGGISAEVFHLNNVHVERIAIQGRVQKNTFGETRTVTVDLHGEDVMYEEIREAGNTRGVPNEILEDIRRSPGGPEWFVKHVNKSNGAKLTLYTSETERVERAWQYIYANGCVGKKSPF